MLYLYRVYDILLQFQRPTTENKVSMTKLINHPVRPVFSNKTSKMCIITNNKPKNQIEKALISSLGLSL